MTTEASTLPAICRGCPHAEGNFHIKLRRFKEAIGVPEAIHHKCPRCGWPWWCYGDDANGCQHRERWPEGALIKEVCPRCRS